LAAKAFGRRVGLQAGVKTGMVKTGMMRASAPVEPPAPGLKASSASANAALKGPLFHLIVKTFRLVLAISLAFAKRMVSVTESAAIRPNS
jgi:hypothetical protein